uniref:Putative secreted protein obp n=1 Tax=Anopheles darlingi TaxID=43151 RepID=A0A2M4D016_ANODA
MPGAPWMMVLMDGRVAVAAAAVRRPQLLQRGSAIAASCPPAYLQATDTATSLRGSWKQRWNDSGEHKRTNCFLNCWYFTGHFTVTNTVIQAPPLLRGEVGLSTKRRTAWDLCIRANRIVNHRLTKKIVFAPLVVCQGCYTTHLGFARLLLELCAPSTRLLEFSFQSSRAVEQHLFAGRVFGKSKTFDAVITFEF